MPDLRIPLSLRDVLGERQSAASLILIALAAITAVVATLPALVAVEWWRGVLAALLIADVAAGAVANLTASTNDHYAARPRSRWVFIAVHVHLPVIALLLGLPLGVALIGWAATIVAAVAINLLADHPVQRVAAGSALVLIACLLVSLPDQQPALFLISMLFAAKVAFAFAVDHSAEAARRWDTRARGVGA